MLYGNPTKLVRHVDETDITLEPQRFYVHTFWRANAGATARTDGQDLLDDKDCPLGSIIKRHKVEILVTPETIEPQQLYIGRIKLSFHDVYAQPIMGGRLPQASYQANSTFSADTNDVGPQLYPEGGGAADVLKVSGADTANQEIGGAASGNGIKDFLLEDMMKHFINLKKVTVFDQRPLMGERWQRIPSKVKRINSGTFYGLYLFNDSDRGATPADTQIKINIKEFWVEKAL